MCRAGVQARGLSLLGPENPEANVVTAFLRPRGRRRQGHPGRLKRRFGIQIAGGQGKLSGKICRIGHCGYYDYRDIVTALGALELVLSDWASRSSWAPGSRPPSAWPADALPAR